MAIGFWKHYTDNLIHVSIFNKAHNESVNFDAIFTENVFDIKQCVELQTY